ncbi:hypothetical protein D4T97_005140 [Siminovitchia acidinfaciens]|uniref:Uncharacterized protein n=1 Tax=Siminovitchia acidinfaciens TaxID=2321395 RepID=A0A429Y431_9BACI|nr:hypothetical protein [Siminovitchia acidinfaciens]RST76170.1 hypothetical protein D4T97_005140 [Siminovitchia acidinfaciens]
MEFFIISIIILFSAFIAIKKVMFDDDEVEVDDNGFKPPYFDFSKYKILYNKAVDFYDDTRVEKANLIFKCVKSKCDVKFIRYHQLLEEEIKKNDFPTEKIDGITTIDFNNNFFTKDQNLWLFRNKTEQRCPKCSYFLEKHEEFDWMKDDENFPWLNTHQLNRRLELLKEEMAEEFAKIQQLELILKDIRSVETFKETYALNSNYDKRIEIKDMLKDITDQLDTLIECAPYYFIKKIAREIKMQLKRRYVLVEKS